MRSNRGILSSSHLTAPSMDDQTAPSSVQRIVPPVKAKIPTCFTKEDVQELRASLSEAAKVAEKNDSEYEEGIKRWSKAAEKRASLIVFPKTSEDVSKAVLFSTKHELELAVCGGGHGTGASSSTQGGLCINLSGMRRVSVNAEKKTVTAEGGALWSDVDMSAARVGLACVGGTVNHTGVGGLTLGGGYGYLTSEYGLVIDNLLSVEFVLADGSIVTCSQHENTDLFWAARGAGTSFGVATKFTYKAHDQPKNVWAAKIIFDNIGAYQPVIDFGNSLLEKKDKKSWMFIGSGHMPPNEEQASILCICFYNGDTMEEAESVFKPLLQMKNAYSKICLMPYYEVNAFINVGLEHGHRRSMKGCAFIPGPESSRDVAWDSFKSLQQFVRECPDAKHSFVLLEFIPSQKICEVEQTATAFANRGPYCNLLYIMSWDDPENDKRVRDFAREHVQVMREKFDNDRKKLRREGNLDPWTASSVGEYFNHEGTRNDGRSVFGPNFERLAELKKRYDPRNVFCKGPNILMESQNGASSLIGGDLALR